MQQKRRAQLLHKARAVVGRRAVDAKADRHAKLQHIRDARDAGGELHVACRAVAHAGAGFGQKLQLLVMKMNAVRVPHIRADPAERLHERQRAHPLAFEHIGFLVLCLTQVRVQADMVLPREDGALPQKLRRDGERRTRRKRDLPHGAERRVMVCFNEAGGVGHDLVDRLHNGVGRQATVLDGQIHGAA